MKKTLKSAMVRLLLEQPIITSNKEKSIYLTFDDGPEPGVTNILLDLLKEHNVKSTFFVIGSKVLEHPVLSRRIVNEKHVIANHSFNHQHFSKLTLKDQILELRNAKDAIGSITGFDTSLFRSPQGYFDLKLLVSIYRNNNKLALWTRDSMDYSEQSSEQIIHQFKSNPVSNNEILLFHDDNIKAIEVLKIMIPIWKENGFTFKVLGDKDFDF